MPQKRLTAGIVKRLSLKHIGVSSYMPANHMPVSHLKVGDVLQTDSACLPGTEEGRTLSWDRVGQAVEHRIKKELGATFSAVASRADVHESSLWKLRKGHGGELSPELRAKIETAIRWPEGTIDTIYHDPEFTPPSEVLSDPERLDQLEQAHEDLKTELVSLRRDVEALVRLLRSGEGS